MSNDIIIDKIMPRTRYIADGTNLEFPFLFSVFSAEDLNVYLNDTLLKNSVYTVLINNDGNGKIIFDTAPAEGKIITIIRNLDIKRTSDFQESGAFRAKAINHELDYQVACIQQLAEKLDRSIVMPPYNASSSILEIPKPQKGRALVWNEEGTNFKNSDLEIDTAFICIANVVPKAEQVAADAAEVREKTQFLDTILEQVNQIENKTDTNSGNVTPEGKRTILSWITPDTSRKTVLTASTGTFEKMGIVHLNSNSWGGANSEILINNSTAAKSTSITNLSNSDNSLMFVNPGDTWRQTQSFSSNQGASTVITFYPFSGDIA